MKSLNLIHLFFSRPRKLILAMLAVSSTASALTPSPVTPPTEQQAEQQLTGPAQSIPSWPAEPTVTDTNHVESKDSRFANDIEALQQELALLKLKDQKAKLEEAIAKTTGEKEKAAEPVKDAFNMDDIQIGISSIYGVGRQYQAVINYQGAEITVKHGSDIDGVWKVLSINTSTVQIRNSKTGKKKTLTMSAPQAQALQSSQTSVLPPLPSPLVVPPSSSEIALPLSFTGK